MTMLAVVWSGGLSSSGQGGGWAPWWLPKQGVESKAKVGGWWG